MWTEKVTWFSNEEGKKGQITGRPARGSGRARPRLLRLPGGRDRRHRSRDLTMVGGKVVYGGGDFAAFDESRPAAGDAGLVAGAQLRRLRRLGRARWRRQGLVAPQLAMTCGCASACNVHGHDHAGAWSSALPVSDSEFLLGRARLRLLGGVTWPGTAPLRRPAPCAGSRCCCSVPPISRGQYKISISGCASRDDPFR